MQENLVEKNLILTGQAATKKLERMAMEVAERNYQEPELLLIGIKENGFLMAQKIENFLQKVYKGNIITVALELNKKKPADIKLSEEISFENKTIILIDDVANSGRTMLYALKPMLEHYPKNIQTLALVERTYKKFPVHLNYVGISVSTAANEYIEVEVEDSAITGAVLKTAE